MDFAWVGELIESLPQSIQTVVVLSGVGLAYKVAQWKWSAEEHPHAEIGELQEALGDVKTQLTNHLPHVIENLNTNVEALAKSIRDLTEQSNRVANSQNVVLDKLDILDRTLNRLDARISK